MTNAIPQPGWYDDPENARNLRWWNGAAWSDHLKPDAGSAARLAYAPAPAAQAPGAQKLRYADREREMRRSNPAAYAAILLALIGLIWNLFALPGVLGLTFGVIGVVRANRLDPRVVRYRGLATAIVAIVLGAISTIEFLVVVTPRLH